MKFTTFADFRVPTTKDRLNRWADKILDIGFSGAVIGLNHDILPEEESKRRGVNPYDFHLIQKEGQIIAAAEALNERNLDVSLMSWYHGDVKYVNKMMDTLIPLVESCKAHRAILDGEYVLLHKSVPEKRQAAATCFAKRLEDEAPGLLTGMTSYAASPKGALEIGREVDQGIGQAYSVWKPVKKKHWTHGDVTAPGHMQRKSLDSWLADYGKYSEICMALPNYWLKRPNMSEAVAFNTAVDKTAEIGVDEVLLWSFKWISGMNPGFTKEFYSKGGARRAKLVQAAINRHK